MLNEERMGLMVWSPLAGGLLSGKYGRDGRGPEGSRRVTFDYPPVNRDRAFNCVDAMRQIADAHHLSVACVALAWLLSKPHVSALIVGARNEEQLQDNLAASEVELSAGEIAELDRVSALPSEYPAWAMERLLGIPRAPETSR